jgi:6-phosphogluconolactonase (cycloisomerase 2 family)
MKKNCFPRFGWRIAFYTSLLMLFVAELNGQEAESAAQLAARIDRLIVQLDDDKFQVREKAEAELTQIGEPALAKLTAASKDASAERSQRAAKVLKEIRRAGLGLRHIGSIRHEALLGAVTLAISPDGRFVYVPAFQTSAVNVFRRDAATGHLEHQATLADAAQLGGIVTLRLSPDGKYAVGACFRAKSIALFSRHAETGELALESVRAHEPEGDLKLEWPIDAIFSTDGRFVYAVDDRLATVVVFEVAEGKRLKLVHTFEGQDRCFDGARGIVAHPDGKTMYVSSRRYGALAVLDVDPATGKLGVRQILRDGQEGIQGLAGTTGACVSRDGKFVYTISGRFEGDQAIGAYKVGEDGKLAVLQEFISEQSDLKDFSGANELTISPDDKYFYASGTTSCSVACFRRDPASGKLQYVTTVQNEATGVGSDLGANGLECSADGRFLYLALENAAAISIFERTSPPQP